jgi:phospholipid/cholesterol/gamma-HCH transport system ATP-binding protein
LIKEVQEKYQSASLVISHDMTCVRMVADRIIMLIEGKNYAEGTYDELMQTADPAIKVFFE